MITQLVEQLKDTDLWPSPDVDALFSALVATAVTAGRDHPTIRDAVALAVTTRIERGDVGRHPVAVRQDHHRFETSSDPFPLKRFCWSPILAGIVAAERLSQGLLVSAVTITRRLSYNRGAVHSFQNGK